MSSRFSPLLSGLTLLVAIGCDADQGSPTGGGNVVRIAPGVPQQVAPPPAAPAEGPPAAGSPNAAEPAQPALVAPAEFPIRLSAGTALPQTAPDGTVMSFSVDFQAGGYQPQGGVRCVLVIERGDGKRVEQPAQVGEKGTWVSVVPDWKPEDGPFQAHVEEIATPGTRRTVSRSVNLE